MNRQRRIVEPPPSALAPTGMETIAPTTERIITMSTKSIMSYTLLFAMALAVVPGSGYAVGRWNWVASGLFEAD